MIVKGYNQNLASWVQAYSADSGGFALRLPEHDPGLDALRQRHHCYPNPPIPQAPRSPGPDPTGSGSSLP